MRNKLMMVSLSRPKSPLTFYLLWVQFDFLFSSRHLGTMRYLHRNKGKKFWEALVLRMTLPNRLTLDYVVR